MKINMVNGSITATAETLEDTKVLLGLDSRVRATREKKEKPHTKSGKRAYASSGPKTACPICSKRIVQLAPHIKYNHSPKVSITKVEE